MKENITIKSKGQVPSSNLSININDISSVAPIVSDSTYSVKVYYADQTATLSRGSEAEILKLFTFDKSPEITIKKLTDYVNSKGIERGGDYDNLTAIIADMKINSNYQYSIFHYIKLLFLSVGKNIKKLFKSPK